MCSFESYPLAFIESFLSLDYEMSPLCDMERGVPERGTAEPSEVTSTAGCPAPCPGNPRFLFGPCTERNWLKAEQQASAGEAASLQARHRQRQPPILQQTGNQFTSLKNRTDKNPKI